MPQTSFLHYFSLSRNENICQVYHENITDDKKRKNQINYFVLGIVAKPCVLL